MIELNMPWIITREDLIWHIDNLCSRLNQRENNNFRSVFTQKLNESILSLKQDISQTQNVLSLKHYKNKYQDILNQLCKTKPYEFNLLEPSLSELFGSSSLSSLMIELLILTFCCVALRHLCYHIFLLINPLAILFQTVTLVSLPLTVLSSVLLGWIFDIIFQEDGTGLNLKGFGCFITILALHNSSLMRQYIFSISALTTSMSYFFPYLSALIIMGVLNVVCQKTYSYFRHKKDYERYTSDIQSEIITTLKDIESSFSDYMAAAKALEKVSLKRNFSKDVLTPALAFFAPQAAITNHVKAQRNICYQPLSELINQLSDHELKSRLDNLLEHYLVQGNAQFFSDAIQEIEMAKSMETRNVCEDSFLLTIIEKILLERILPIPSNAPKGP